MSAVVDNKPAARGGLAEKLAFYNALQSVTNTIHATTHLDEIILDLGPYAASSALIASRSMWPATAGNPSSPRSRPALTPTRISSCRSRGPERGRLRRIAQADRQHPRRLRRQGARGLQPASELPPAGRRPRRAITRGRCSSRRWSKRRAASWSASCSSSTPRPASRFRRRWKGCRPALRHARHCAGRRQRPATPIKGKYDALVANGVISAEELELATRSARRKNRDVETVLIDEVPGQAERDRRGSGGLFRRPLRAARGSTAQSLSHPAQEPEPGFPGEQRDGCPSTRPSEGMVVLTTDPERLRRVARRQERSIPRTRSTAGSAATREFTQGAGPDGSVRRRRRPSARAIDRRPALRHADDGGDEARGGHEVGGRGQRGGQGREPDHHRRVPSRRLGHPHRAERQGPRRRRSLPHRRRMLRVSGRARGLSQPAHRAHQDHGGPRHLRASQAAGRQDRFPSASAIIELRVATLPTVDGTRTPSSASSRRRSRYRSTRWASASATCGSCGRRSSNRTGSFCVRAHGLGQDHHAALGARRHQQAGHQDLDGRGPGRDHAARAAAGSGQPEVRPDLCRRHARVLARRPGCHHGRRDARPKPRRSASKRR